MLNYLKKRLNQTLYYAEGLIQIYIIYPLFVVSFFFLNKFSGFGGGGGPGGVPAGFTVLLFAVSAALFVLSFLCFLNGFIFLKGSSGGGGGVGGPAGAAVCANECEQMHNNPTTNGSISRYLSLAL